MGNKRNQREKKYEEKGEIRKQAKKRRKKFKKNKRRGEELASMRTRRMMHPRTSGLRSRRKPHTSDKIPVERKVIDTVEGKYNARHFKFIPRELGPG